MTKPQPTTPLPSALKGVRILSLSLNLPGPAALQRCKNMGATCIKLEPPVPAGVASGVTSDPMSLYSRIAYDALHTGIRVVVANLKTEAGQKSLHRELAKAQVLLTSFRPSALDKLGLGWKTLHRLYPSLSMVAIVGAPGAAAEEPGHDLTYQAANDLITGLELPATLYADMGGALMASEAVLQAVLLQRQKDKGSFIEVALSDAAAHLALPRAWGATLPGTLLNGQHAGYQVYPCKDGRVALAALEPHFAQPLCALAGITWSGPATMLEAATREQIARFVANKTRKALDKLAAEHDIPLKTLLT
jgi:crotonobetainyl-CoA:carnitine CoA-transferase CaiB-like acyl-CoA transferase